MRRKLLAFLLMVMASVVAAQQSRETLTNEAIIRMRSMGFPEEMIIRAIDHSPGAYDTSADGLLVLEEAEVSDNVIAAMVQKTITAEPGKESTANLSPTATRTPLFSPSTPVTSSSSRALSKLRTPNSMAPTAHPAGSGYGRTNGRTNGLRPRVFLEAKSHSDSWTAGRNQSMEMSKDFGDVCPGVRVSIKHEISDYTVFLNHTEHGFYRDNQLQVLNRAGDLVSGTKEGGSIKSRVKIACADIETDWESSRR
jgi:hypothetical protein